MGRAASVLRSEEPAPVPAPLMLSRIGEELDDLAFLVARVEEAVGHAVSGAVAVDAERLRDLQALDLVRQTLQDLAAAARGSAAGADLAGIAETMRLGQVRARILGADCTEGAESGDVSLF